MIISCRKSAFKLRRISTKTKKFKFIGGEKYNQKLLEMVQVTVMLRLFWWNLRNSEKHAFFYVICKNGQNQGFWATIVSFFKKIYKVYLLIKPFVLIKRL